MRSRKITDDERGGSRRYGDACAVARALDLVGERWALLVVRELILGPCRFTELRRGLPGISANVLTQRLDGLERAGILRFAVLPPPSSAPVYELTEWGYEAEVIVRALGRWGARSPRPDPTLAFSTASLILSLRTMFDAERGAGFKKRVGLRVEGRNFLARVKKGRLILGEGGIEGADCVLAGRAPTIAALVYADASARALVEAAELDVEGDESVVPKFVRMFSLPQPAPAAGSAVREGASPAIV